MRFIRGNLKTILFNPIAPHKEGAEVQILL